MSLCHSTTQPLHQGAGHAGKTEPEVPLAHKKAAGWTPREDVAFSVFNPAIMIVYNVPILCLLQS